MFRAIVVLFFNIILTTTLFSQPDDVWLHSFQNPGDDGIRDVYPVSDGDYILCGYSGESEFLVIRCDGEGNEIWSNTYGEGQEHQSAWTVVETDDGNFLIGGRNQDHFSALLINGNGNRIWWNDYFEGICHSVIELKSGEFLLSGHDEERFGMQHKIGKLLMVNGDGRLLWSQSYDPGVYCDLFAMRETDGGIVLAGHKYVGVMRFETWVIKVDFDGGIIWDETHRFGHSSTAYSMVSGCDDGFAMTGTGIFGEPFKFFILKIDDEGQREWMQTYDGMHPDNMAKAACITRLNNMGYAVVGSERDVWGPRIYTPMVVNTNAVGEEQWRRKYDFEGDLGSVIIGHDNSLLAGGVIRTDEDEMGKDAMIMKLEPDRYAPIYIDWSPDDTTLRVIPGDSISFSVRVIDLQDDEIWYSWIMGEDTLGYDTTLTIHFEEMGEFEVTSLVTDGEHHASKTWQISVRAFYIDTYQPDSLSMTIRREQNVNFSIDVVAINIDEVNYVWTLTGRDNQQEDISSDPNVSIDFNLTGRHQLAAQAFDDEDFDLVTWQIEVRSIIYWWWPHSLNLTCHLGDTLLFNVTPFNPNLDSTQCNWYYDLSNHRGRGFWKTVVFEEAGLHSVNATVREGEERDDVTWEISVIEPEAVKHDDGVTPVSNILYPAAPNPFNSSVDISFDIVATQRITLSIFDISGREITRLIDGVKVTGFHSETWVANSKSAGVYFVRLRTSDKDLFTKVMLIR